MYLSFSEKGEKYDKPSTLTWMSEWIDKRGSNFVFFLALFFGGSFSLCSCRENKDVAMEIWAEVVKIDEIGSSK